MGFIFLVVILLLITEQICRLHKKSLLELLHPSWFQDVTTFPEKAFECKRNCTMFDSIVKQGLVKMKQTKIVFAGLCINIEDKMDKLVKRMEHLGSFFSEYKIVIFENDSKDNTRARLLAWQDSNPNVHIVECPEHEYCKLATLSATKHGTFSPSRMKKMADYRNRTLKTIKEHYAHYDCLCILDLDITGPVSITGLAHSFGLYDKWDSISAFGLNGISLTAGTPVYYDPIAFKDLAGHNIHRRLIDSIPIIKQVMQNKRGDLPFQVQSAFAGLALYKMHVIRQNIDYTPHDGIYVCEHIILHENMIRAGFDRIYVNPNMTVLVGAQGDVNKYPFY